jgi:predicted O-methyltransferase YrrM
MNAAAQEKKYNFSTGHHLYHEQNWKKVLASYKGRPDVRYLEVGVFEGRSLIWMLENILTHETARATGMDIFPGDMKEIYLSNLKISGFADKVTTITGYSQLELRKLEPQSFDIIYIDGSHVACDVLSDAVMSWQVLKENGVMIFDDYLYGLDLPSDLRPQVSIDSFITAFRNSLEVISHSYQVMVQKKSAWPGRFPLGRLAYYWGTDSLCKSGPEDKIKIPENEKQVIRQIIMTRKFGELGYSPDPAMLSDPAFEALKSGLSLKPNFNFGSPADVPVRGDFDGDGKADLALWVRPCAVWLVKDRPLLLHGAAGDIPVPGDYDGDGKTDIAVFKPSTGVWAVCDLFQVKYGEDGDIPVPGDFNGDGKTDIAIFRPSNGGWAIKDQFSVNYGAQGDIPVPGDYDGDGIDTMAVFRPSLGTWMFRNGPPVKFGAAGDIPVPGDYDGDGADDIAVFRPSTGTWMIRDLRPLEFGAPGDIPVPGDYDGNGTVDIAVYSPSKGCWAVYGQFQVPFGSREKIPFVK